MFWGTLAPFEGEHNQCTEHRERKCALKERSLGWLKTNEKEGKKTRKLGGSGVGGGSGRSGVGGEGGMNMLKIHCITFSKINKTIVLEKKKGAWRNA